MAVSIRDVAKQSSLSCETILEGLIAPSALEPEVVRFIMKNIRESGFLDTFSRWKTGRRTPSIAVLTPMVDSASSLEMFKGIDRAMSALGLNTSMVVLPTRFSPVFREEILQGIIPFNMFDAVITLDIKPDEETVEKYRNLGKALVMLNASVAGGQSVLLENQKGMSIGVNYLYNKGYRRIGLMNGPTGGSEPGSVPSERLIGYLMALHRLGLPFDESLVYETPDYDTDSGIHGFEYFRSKGEMPEAVFCASGDLSALGFINAAVIAGLRVPEDIAVMGYDDIPISGLVIPALTTIRQRLMIAGAGALVLVLESVVNGPGENLVIMPELVTRTSA